MWYFNVKSLGTNFVSVEFCLDKTLMNYIGLVIMVILCVGTNSQRCIPWGSNYENNLSCTNCAQAVDNECCSFVETLSNGYIAKHDSYAIKLQVSSFFGSLTRTCKPISSMDAY